MITIFTNPRPFFNHFDTIQRNAIQSWLKLKPECEIVLFEDEEKTTSKVAEEFGLRCITDIACDEFGTPLLSDVLNKVQNLASYSIIAQINTDIILMFDFLDMIKRINTIMGEKPFFLSGRRWDLEIKENINFSKADWENELREKIKKEGKLHGFAGMDYWIFPKNLLFDPPPFIVGRPGMDSWLVFKAKKLKIPVIDATEIVTIIHQNHNYPQKRKPFFEIEKKRNLKLAGGLTNMCTLRDADWILTKDGLRRPPYPRRIFSQLSLFYPWRFVLALKRKLWQIISNLFQ
jgi:hypothetical protein